MAHEENRPIRPTDRGTIVNRKKSAKTDLSHWLDIGSAQKLSWPGRIFVAHLLPNVSDFAASLTSGILSEYLLISLDATSWLECLAVRAV